MKRLCIYCEKESDNPWLLVCKKCSKIWNENWKKFVPVDEEYSELIKNCEEYIKQTMTGHTCGREISGSPELFCSSDCFGCFPDTIQHYRNAAQMVIAWTTNWMQKNIMKNVLLKEIR